MTLIKLLCSFNLACAAMLIATACAPEEVTNQREQRYLDCMRDAQYSYYDSIERLRDVQNICMEATK